MINNLTGLVLIHDSCVTRFNTIGARCNYCLAAVSERRLNITEKETKRRQRQRLSATKTMMKSFQVVTLFAIIGAALAFAPNQIPQGMLFIC